MLNSDKRFTHEKHEVAANRTSAAKPFRFKHAKMGTFKEAMTAPKKRSVCNSNLWNGALTQYERIDITRQPADEGGFGHLHVASARAARLGREAQTLGVPVREVLRLPSRHPSRVFNF